ncbi:MAG: hypothetical protein K2J64_02485 [Desulfovibrio sp.]|nr:hypothetical protein [Desulfovibrio sp.]
MQKKLFVAAMLAQLCFGCAARDQDGQGKRIGTGLGAVAGAGALAAVGNPCAGMAVLVQGALEVSGVKDALGSLGRDEPDPKFIAFMEKLQRDAEKRRAAQRLAEEAANARAGADGENAPPKGCAAPSDVVAANPGKAPPGGLDHRPAREDTIERAVPENVR